MAEPATHGTADDAPQREPAGVATGVVVAVMAGLAGFVALTLGGVWVFYAATVTRPTLPSPTRFEAPRLQTDRGTDELARLEAAQRAKLDGYGWIDRDQKLIRIPLQRAMQAIVARRERGYDPVDGDSQAADPSRNGGGP
jgi:hypothetical protein